MYHRREQNFGRDSKENPTIFKTRSCLDSVGGITKTHFITQHLLIKHVNIRQPCTQAGLDANILRGTLTNYLLEYTITISSK